MKELRRDILQCIGNTSLLALRNIVPRNGSRDGQAPHRLIN